MVEQHLDHRRHHHRRGDAVPLGHVEHGRWIEHRHERCRAADRGDRQHTAERRGMEHRRLVQVHVFVGERPPGGDLVEVEHRGAVVDHDALRQPGRPARVHQNDDVVLFRLVGDDRTARRQHRVVLHVVGCVGLTDEHDLLDRRLRAHPVHDRREEPVDEAHGGGGVLQDELQLLGCEPQVQRVDDARAQERGVVQLEVLVTVERHHREAVGRRQPELRTQPGREPQRALHVLRVGGREVAVERRRLVGEVLGGRQQHAVVDEVFHAAMIPREAGHGNGATARGILVECRARRWTRSSPFSARRGTGWWKRASPPTRSWPSTSGASGPRRCRSCSHRRPTWPSRRFRPTASRPSC